MRALRLAALALVAALTQSSFAAESSAALDEARRLASAGAADLALERIDREQPKQADAPAWADWEALRIELLASRGRDAQVLARTRSYPGAAPAGRAYVDVLTTAVRVAQRAGDPAQAQRLLARLFLLSDLGSSEYRAARMSVIDLHLAAGDADAAYRSMLRFQQDFNPVRSDEAERFVAGLVAADRVNEAASWLTRLDPVSPWSALLRMRAGLLSSDAAVGMARASIAKGSGEGAWALLAAAGRAQNNRAIAIEVAERRLNATGQRPTLRSAQEAEALWRLYSETAQQSANQAQLLSGDDAAWLTQAARMTKTQPQLSRALAGHIALNGASPRARDEARLNLLGALRDAKLAQVALRLFADLPQFAVASMEPRLRMALGHLALDEGHGELAARYWHKLDAPSGASGLQWQARYCAALMQSGRFEEALAATRGLIAAKPPPSAEVLRPLVDIAGYALVRGEARTAQALLTMLLPVVADADRGAVWQGLARVHDWSSDHRAAAAAYLNAAAVVAVPEADREGLRAREAAAISLAKAGLREDARSVYEWLARNAKDAGIRDAAIRMLRTLQ